MIMNEWAGASRIVFFGPACVIEGLNDEGIHLAAVFRGLLFQFEFLRCLGYI